jgi:hypothetical protein
MVLVSPSAAESVTHQESAKTVKRDSGRKMAALIVKVSSGDLIRNNPIP